MKSSYTLCVHKVSGIFLAARVEIWGYAVSVIEGIKRFMRGTESIESVNKRKGNSLLFQSDIFTHT